MSNSSNYLQNSATLGVSSRRKLVGTVVVGKDKKNLNDNLSTQLEKYLGKDINPKLTSSQKHNSKLRKRR